MSHFQLSSHCCASHARPLCPTNSKLQVGRGDSEDVSGCAQEMCLQKQRFPSSGWQQGQTRAWGHRWVSEPPGQTWLCPWVSVEHILGLDEAWTIHCSAWSTKPMEAARLIIPFINSYRLLDLSFLCLEMLLGLFAVTFPGSDMGQTSLWLLKSSCLSFTKIK